MNDQLSQLAAVAAAAAAVSPLDHLIPRFQGPLQGTQQQFPYPMFQMPSVAFPNSPGAFSVGKFPNPKSVLRLGNNKEAQQFLSRGGQVIIRMRGLPYDCSAKQVTDFFSTGGGDQTCQVLDEESGVLFVRKPDGRATGDAFVLFAEEADAEKALQKHKEVIGSRYIELFRSTTAEVQQVLNRTMEQHTINRLHQQQQQHQNSLQSHNSHAVAAAAVAAAAAAAASGINNGGGGIGVGQMPPLISHLPTQVGQVPVVLPQQLITAGTRKDCIRLRGLPYEAQVEHILEFLGDNAKNIVYQGVHMVYNAQGQPSGEAFIQMNSEHTAYAASQQRHHRYMVFGKKQRYIEVFQCSGEDMSLVLTGAAATASAGGGGGSSGNNQSSSSSSSSPSPTSGSKNTAPGLLQHPGMLPLPSPASAAAMQQQQQSQQIDQLAQQQQQFLFAQQLQAAYQQEQMFKQPPQAATAQQPQYTAVPSMHTQSGLLFSQPNNSLLRLPSMQPANSFYPGAAAATNAAGLFQNQALFAAAAAAAAAFNQQQRFLLQQQQSAALIMQQQQQQQLALAFAANPNAYLQQAMPNQAVSQASLGGKRSFEQAFAYASAAAAAGQQGGGKRAYTISANPTTYTTPSNGTN